MDVCEYDVCLCVNMMSNCAKIRCLFVGTLLRERIQSSLQFHLWICVYFRI